MIEYHIRSAALANRTRCGETLNDDRKSIQGFAVTTVVLNERTSTAKSTLPGMCSSCFDGSGDR